MLFIAFPILNLISTSADPAEAILVVIGTVVFAGLMLATSPFLGTRVREGKAVTACRRPSAGSPRPRRPSSSCWRSR